MELVYGFIARESIMTIFIMAFQKIQLKLEFDKKRMIKLLMFGLPLTGSRLIWYLNQNFDYFLVGKYLGDSVLGIYRLSFVIGRSPMKKVWIIVNKITIPIFSKIAEDNERIKKYFLKINLYLALIIVPANVFLFIIANDFISIILKEKWLPILIPLRVFLVLTIIEGITLTCAPVLVARGKPVINLKISMIATIIFIPALFIGIQYGLIGVLIAWSIYTPLFAYAKMSIVLKELKLPFMEFFNNLKEIFLNAFIAAITIIFLRHTVTNHVGILSRFLLEIAVACLVYMFLIFIWPGKYGKEIKDIYNNVVGKVIVKKAGSALI